MFPHWSREEGGQLSGPSKAVQESPGVVSACQSQPCQAKPTPSNRRESPLATTSSVQIHQLFLSLAHPCEVSASFPSCSSPEEWQWGTSISKQLRVGHIYLSLGAGPFFRPLPSKMCLLLELLPPNTQFPWELVIIKERKKKKKASALGWASPGSWGLAPGSSLPAMPNTPRAQNKPKPSLYVDDALL